MPTYPPAFIDRRLYSLGAPRRLLEEAERFFRGRLGLSAPRRGALLEYWMYKGRVVADEDWALAVIDDGPVGFALGRGVELSTLYLGGRFNTGANALGLLRVLTRRVDYYIAGESCMSPPPIELCPVLTGAGWERHPRLEYWYDLRQGPPRGREDCFGSTQRLREFAPEDLAEVAVLQATCFLGGDEARVQPRLSDPRSSRELLLDILDGRYGEFFRKGSLVLQNATGGLEGFLLSTIVETPGRRRANIISLGVSPNRRGAGLARRLLSRALVVFHALGLDSVLLETGTVNDRARALYHSLGFNLCSRGALYRWPTT